MKPFTLVCFAAMVLAASAAVYGNVPPPPPPPRPATPPPMVWEYRVEEGFPRTAAFNRLGEEGWELATSYYNLPSGPAIHTFKRPKR
ncbi:MAG: hypothetical protein U0804_16055 [Gemmataceae bacterium]